MLLNNLGNRVINNYLIKVSDGYILIDAGGKKAYDQFLSKLAEANVALSDIKYVVLTHVHADHAGFLKQLLNDSKATLIYDDRAKARLEAGKNNMNVYVSTLTNLIGSYITTSFIDLTQCFPAVKTDNYINYDAQPLKKYDIELIPLRGHTQADLAVKVEDNLFVGDICMNGIPSYKHFPAWLENKYELLSSWQQIIAMDGVTTVYPAHGKPFPKKELYSCYAYWQDKGVYSLKKVK